MDWTAILKQGGVPEPPGYRETLEVMEARPKALPKKKKTKGKKKR